MSAPSVDRARRTQSERRAESDASIIEAATELFASQGCVRTTLNEVGERAGYTGGLVSNRFGSKVGLVRAVLDEIFQQFLVETLDSIDQIPSVADRLAMYVQVFLARLAEPRGDVRALYVVMGEAIGAVPELCDDVVWFTEHTLDGLAALIQLGIDNGEFLEGTDATRAATLLLAMLRGVTLDHLVRPDASDPTELTPDICRFLESYLGIEQRRRIT